MVSTALLALGAYILLNRRPVEGLDSQITKPSAPTQQDVAESNQPTIQAVQRRQQFSTPQEIQAGFIDAELRDLNAALTEDTLAIVLNPDGSVPAQPFSGEDVKATLASGDIAAAVRQVGLTADESTLDLSPQQFEVIRQGSRDAEQIRIDAFISSQRNLRGRTFDQLSRSEKNFVLGRF